MKIGEIKSTFIKPLSEDGWRWYYSQFHRNIIYAYNKNEFKESIIFMKR